MQSVFGTVVLVVCGVGIAAAVIALLLSRRTWDDFGKDHLLRDSDRPDPGSPGTATRQPDRDAEICQLLEARNARRRRRGDAETDVEQELARLTAPQVDGELREEIRQLVIARNHRRARQGKPPLDVEAEISRQIAGLHGV
jgi:hypothetical protein